MIYIDFQQHLFPAQRLIIQLFPEVAPLTCEKFLSSLLAIQIDKSSEVKLNRVTPSSLLIFSKQPGDTNSDKYFPDESFYLNHSGLGWISANNDGPDYNDPESFLVSLTKNQHLDGKHTVFARVVQGEELLQKLSTSVPLGPAGVPLVDVRVLKVGLVLGVEFEESD